MYDFAGEWGLVLAGGGGKGAFQIGAFKAIRELIPDINIAGISGTSVGALNLALFAQNDQSVAQAVWESISPSMFLSTRLSMFDMNEGLFLRDGLLEMIDQYVNLEMLSHSKIPLYCTTSKYDTEISKHAVYHLLNGMSLDRIKQVLLASSAINYVYEPVLLDGEIHKDGGNCDNTPVYPLYEKGIRQFIVISLDVDSTINSRQFEGAKFFHIKPGRSIGSLFSGTMDFSAKNAKFRMQQGYIDTIRYIKDYKGEMLYEDDPELSAEEIASYKQLEFEIKLQNMNELVSGHMNSLETLINKYGGNDETSTTIK